MLQHSSVTPLAEDLMTFTKGCRGVVCSNYFTLSTITPPWFVTQEPFDTILKYNNHKTFPNNKTVIVAKSLANVS